MGVFYQNIESKRFLEVVDELINNHNVNNDAHFCKTMEFSAQSFSQIRKGKRDVTVDLLSKLVSRYSGNPIFIFTGVGDLLLNKVSGPKQTTTQVANPSPALNSEEFINELKSENERLKKLMDYYFRQGELNINYTRLLEEQNKELLKELGGVKK
ncbi:MAG: hypothetical protein DI539_19535 [Flavobacterium psychrophilum]|nr:MAG: hypothetical protein DI539_19535 [Flavobacterium psychrophilum]